MKRIFPILLSISLSLSACSESSPVDNELVDSGNKPVDEENSFRDKFIKILPELKDYPNFKLDEIKENGDVILGGINNEKYIFAIFSKDDKLIAKSEYVLDSDWKGKLKFAYVGQTEKYSNIFYLTLSPKDLFMSSFDENGIVQILNVVDNTIYKIGNAQNSNIHYKTHFLQKSYDVISFLSEDKLLAFTHKGKLLNSLSSFDAVGVINKYVVINKEEAVIVSDNNDQLLFKCVTLKKPFGERTIIWSKEYKISDWIRIGDESKNVQLDCYDDEKHVICEYSAIGKKYNSQGDLQDFSESKIIKVDKLTGELIN